MNSNDFKLKIRTNSLKISLPSELNSVLVVVKCNELDWPSTREKKWWNTIFIALYLSLSFDTQGFFRQVVDLIC